MTFKHRKFKIYSRAIGTDVEKVTFTPRLLTRLTSQKSVKVGITL